MRSTIFLSCLVLSLPVAAQVQVSGTAGVQGGLGNATPLDGEVRLDIAAPQFSVSPYIGASLLTRETEGIVEDHEFLYPATGQSYTSHLEQQSDGFGLRYGLSTTYRPMPTTTLTLCGEGLLRDEHVLATRLETLTPAPDDEDYTTPRSHIESVIDDPTHRSQTLRGALSLHHVFSEFSGVLDADYQVSRVTFERERDIYGLDNYAFVPYISNVHISDAATTHHTGTLRYTQSLADGHTVGMGLRAEMRRIHSSDLQVLNKQSVLDTTFRHNMYVAAAWGEYGYKHAAFDVNARLEYVFTRMRGRNLQDVVPSLRATYHLTRAHHLTFVYGLRLVRPDLALLNPAQIRDAHTLSYGNQNLEGMHAHQASLAHAWRIPGVTLTTTAAHIWADDGFNAIWMFRDGIRVYTWGNEGIRRAWSVTPDLTYKPSEATTLRAKATLMWDKRIAEAISMEKEHIGIDASLCLEQQFSAAFKGDLHCSYAEGNTIDLYSHQSRQYAAGLQATCVIPAVPGLNLSLMADYVSHGHAVVTQGAYIGIISTHPEHDYLLKAALQYKF